MTIITLVALYVIVPTFVAAFLGPIFNELKTPLQIAAVVGAVVLWPVTLLVVAFGCVVAFIWSIPKLVRKIAAELVKEIDDEEKL